MSIKKYVSCPYMEKALIFHPHSIEHCSVPVEGKEWHTPMAAAYHGGPLPIDEILESRRRYREIYAQIEKHPEVYCHGCVHLSNREWDDRYLFDNLHFNQSMICNLRCSFCIQRAFSREEQTADYDMLPVFESMLKLDSLDPDAFIFWAGGEPTLLQDFEPALDLAVRHGTRNEIATNSTIFCETLYRHLKNPRVSMKTSVDCGTEETFLRMKKRDWFDRVWENLSRYASTGGNVSAKYIISHENLADKDLEGFVNLVQRHHIRSVYIDINHNFKPGETADRHVYATVVLIDALKQIGVEVECGLHSLAAVPNFNDRVDRMRQQIADGNAAPPEPSPTVTGFENSSQALDDQVSAPAPKAPSCFVIDENYFIDVAPPSLPDKYLTHSRLYTRREDLLALIPKAGTYAEIGAGTGYFSIQIWEQLSPSRFYIVDSDFSTFNYSFFNEKLAGNSVFLRGGSFAETLSRFDNEYFDMIYIDEEHSYDGMKKILAQAQLKIKQRGLILCNDYTIYSPLESVKYGVPRAVNEFCIEANFEIVALALHPWGYHDVALRRGALSADHMDG
jgi:organic radical activating enzyme